ncbi:hypothetical protein ACWDTI_17195 [Gordonia sp. NPDC003424]
MNEITCEACGAANPPGTQFCTECDAYLTWSKPAAQPSPGTAPSASPSATVATAPTRATAAEMGKVIAPTVEITHPAVTLDPAAQIAVEMLMLNPSSIVDGYAVEIPEAPSWLTVHHDELRLLPKTDSTITLSVGIADGPLPPAGTTAVKLLVRSLTDPAKTTSAQIEVTVPRIGAPVTITARPTVVRLTDTTDGTVQLSLDNSASNYPQPVSLSASDTEGVVQFSMSPDRATIPAGETSAATMTFRCPGIGFGDECTRMITVVAHSGDDKTEASVTVNQSRSEAPAHVPIKLRLEPSVSRVQDFTMADLTFVVDNRRGNEDRTLTVGGRDPEGRVTFTFPTSQVHVPAGQITALPVTVAAAGPAEGAEVSYPFSIIATDELDEVEASGTLTLLSSAPAITTATLRLHPSKISVRNSSRGRTAVIVDNTGSDRWLKVHLAASDPEAAVRISINPPTVDVPPRQSVWAEATVAADPPDPGDTSERPISFVATDGRATMTCDGSFAQRTSDWMPIARVVLTLLGAALAAIGAFKPWTAKQFDYYVMQLGAQVPEDADKVVFQTQPAARLAILVLAGAMALGVFAKTGKPTQTAALAMVAALVGYMVFLVVNHHVGIGGPMYGAIMVGVGAALGFLGGLCIRKR